MRDLNRLDRPALLGSILVLALAIFVSMGTGAQPEAAGFAVGYVNSELAMQGHPRFKAAQEQVASYRATRLKELDSYKNRTLTDAEKKSVMVKNETIAIEVDKKHDQVFGPIAVDVEKAINAVGAKSGVEVVLESAAVRFGGIDLTPAVITEVAKYK